MIPRLSRNDRKGLAEDVVVQFPDEWGEDTRHHFDDAGRREFMIIDR